MTRTQTWLAVIIGPPAVIFAFVMGLYTYMTASISPLHPDAQAVPSVTDSAPLPQWAGAVDQGRQIARAALAQQNLPGLSVAVGTGGEIVWAEGFGWADLDKRVPIAPHMRFRIGTASTVLTSAAVGLLLENDRLTLDERIQSYVPAFPEKQWPVTLRQVMGHVAGVRSDGGDEGPLFSVRCERPVEALPHFKDSALLFEPGTRYRYSRYGWILVSAAVEAAAGEPFFSYMRTKVFKPLGMDDTEADSASEPIPDRVTPYFPRFSADPRYGPDPMRPVDYSCYAGSSAFLSTPSDLVRFGMGISGGLRQRFGARGGRFLQPDTVKLLQTSQRLASGEATGYGLGWDLETATLAGRQTLVIGQNGDVLGGRVASLMTFEGHDLVVAVTSNISYADTFALGLKIAEAFAQRAEGPARR
jgi:CubicO group peptidase (beta-lactamase class C family)